MASGLALVLVGAAACDCLPTSPSAAGASATNGLNGSQSSATVSSLTVSGKTNLTVGEHTPLTAVVHFNDKTAKDVTHDASWITDNPAVCTIDDGGMLASVAIGSCTASAVYQQTVGELPITIKGSPTSSPTPAPTPGPGTVVVTSVSVQGANSVQLGTSTPWTATAVLSDGSSRVVTNDAAWASLAPSVASVSASGFVTGQSPGTTTIQAFYQGKGGSGVINVTTNPVPAATVQSLTITGNPNVLVGSTTQLTATAQMSDGSSQDVTTPAAWSSGTPSVAAVSAGTVTGVSAGSSPIQAAFGGKTAQVMVTVSATAAQRQLIGIDVTSDIDLSTARLRTARTIRAAATHVSSVQIGQRVQMHVYGHYSDGSTEEVTRSATYSSDSPALVVDGNGLANVLLTGADAFLDPTHDINAHYGGYTATAHMTITPPAIAGLQVNQNGPISLGAGQQLPPVQTTFQDATQTQLPATFPGMNWTATPRGGLSTLLQNVGAQSLADVFGVNNGVVTVTNPTLFNQLVTMSGGSLPVSLTSSLNGVTSNTVPATVGN